MQLDECIKESTFFYIHSLNSLNESFLSFLGEIRLSALVAEHNLPLAVMDHLVKAENCEHFFRISRIRKGRC
jgi:hypothetical protein